jgi:hypothetical protein
MNVCSNFLSYVPGVRTSPFKNFYCSWSLVSKLSNFHWDGTALVAIYLSKLSIKVIYGYVLEIV